MNVEPVYIEKCLDYDPEKIRNIILDAIKFLKIKIPEEKKILFKPNILGAYTPDQHITTHPSIVEALINIFLKNNNTIILGDSSGLRLHGGTTIALKKSGITDLGRKNVSVCSFDEKPSHIFTNERNKILKKINLTGFLSEVDYVVNIPKLKSHQFMRYTGAVKNLFGCLPGGIKQNCHIRAPNPKVFANLLIDVYSFIKPKILLNVIDGIMGIEGSGPGPSGKVKKIGLIGVSGDALAMDIIFSAIIGAKPKSILTNNAGIQRGLLKKKIILNKSIPKIQYKLPNVVALPDFIYRYFASFSYYKPQIDIEKCRKCGLCAKVCPAKAISMQEYPIINKDKCIYCYCCHENCPHSVIELKDNIFLKLFNAFSK